MSTQQQNAHGNQEAVRDDPVIEDRFVAYHEAGHAVVDLSHGLQVDQVTIVPNKECLGSCKGPSVYGYQVRNKRERKQIARQCILSLYAGFEAERCVNPSAAIPGDFDVALSVSRQEQILPRKCSYVCDELHDAYLRRLQAEARRLVRRHWLAICAVAEVLVQKKRLSGAEVEAIVAGL